MTTVQHIDQVRAIFTPDNSVTLKTVTDTFFPDLDKDFPDFKDHILISQFFFEEAWPTWEIHRRGDELVMRLSGDTDMILSNEDGSETIMRVSTPGEYVVIPRNTWHTARPFTPTTMLFITPGEGTLNALEPNGDPV